MVTVPLPCGIPAGCLFWLSSLRSYLRFLSTLWELYNTAPVVWDPPSHQVDFTQPGVRYLFHLLPYLGFFWISLCKTFRHQYVEQPYTRMWYGLSRHCLLMGQTQSLPWLNFILTIQDADVTTIRTLQHIKVESCTKWYQPFHNVVHKQQSHKGIMSIEASQYGLAHIRCATGN
jgi:hypothetical protein